jgi:hypothetical protein
MRLTTNDIACYIRCPLLRKREGKDAITAPLSLFEHNIHHSIMTAEQAALLKGSTVNPRKLCRAWDKIWWAAATDLPAAEAEQKALKAAELFTDYCKYEFSGYPTIGTDIQIDVPLPHNTLTVSLDIIKTNIEARYLNTVILDFTKIDIKPARSPRLKTLAYALYQGRGEVITIITVGPGANSGKLKTTFAVFRPEDMTDIYKMLCHADDGIYRNAAYANPWSCEGCNSCQSSEL